ncbi:hypothetical protein NFI96_015889 [Prochilodus magdalenae]|nr:hypothetical protein NFI96_015889 [Prochilodus magdalenae]
MYFELAQQKEKCIIEEIPEGTLVTGYFFLERVQQKKEDNSPHLGLTVTVKDPNAEVLLMKRFGKHGKFTFTSHASGQHFLCVRSNCTRFSELIGDRLKVHLDVQVGEHVMDPSTERAKDTVKTMEFKIRHLIDQIQHINRQQNFQRTMSHWICCNSCFKSPGPDGQLAVTSCGHIICNVCFLKGKEGECFICKAKCQLSPLSNKSSAEVKALFSDINTIATKYLSEINKVTISVVMQFQARHQKRLLTHCQQKAGNEKMKQTEIKMQQEMQQMSKKITEQSAYISKLEVALQHQSSRLGSQSNRDVLGAENSKPVTKIPFSSPVSLPHHLSTTSLVENMDVDSRGFSRKPEISGSVPRICLISTPKDGRIGTVSHRATSQSSVVGHSVQSAAVRREFPSSFKEPMLSSSTSALYRREAPWESPVFKLAPAFKYLSKSSLGHPP